MILTRHARWRVAQRAITVSALQLVLNRGRRFEVDSREIYYLGRRELERLHVPAHEQERLEGITVIFSRDGHVITVFRDRRGIKARLKRRGHRGHERGRKGRRWRAWHRRSAWVYRLVDPAVEVLEEAMALGLCEDARVA